ncbi:hypothetical protein G6F35_018175 [Rhizopus arrhizus]|nr:hypothetical protein G6F35_018175 [Rhizopus arrhizus]KAG1245580.1 hypothetical protein G6F65_021153 [Rhizopus arrhizus]
MVLDGGDRYAEAARDLGLGGLPHPARAAVRPAPWPAPRSRSPRPAPTDSGPPAGGCGGSIRGRGRWPGWPPAGTDMRAGCRWPGCRRPHAP